MKRLLQSASSLLYPEVCYGCGADGEAPLWLCSSCMGQLQLLDIWDRCRRCFASEGAPNCGSCDGSCWTGQGALFAGQGLPAALIGRLCHQPHPQALSLLTSLIIVQWERLGWPRCHQLLISPHSRWQRAGRLLRELQRLIAQRWQLGAPHQLGQRIGLLTLRLSHLNQTHPLAMQARSMYALALLE
jgi:predicted amidophosphoribosyltransferase